MVDEPCERGDWRVLCHWFFTGCVVVDQKLLGRLSRHRARSGHPSNPSNATAVHPQNLYEVEARRLRVLASL